MNKRFSSIKHLLFVAALLLCLNGKSTAVSQNDRDFARWGRQTLDVIERDHRIANRAGYYESHEQKDIAFTWGNAMLLLAYSKAAQCDVAYHEPLNRLLEHIETYWVVDNGIGGYDVLPHPRKTVDRYYDDNAWIAMGQIDAYDATGNKSYLQAAGRTLQFCLSGIDPDSGGIWWRESWENERRKTKNTCSVAPTAFACLRYYEATRDTSYLDTAKTLLSWLDTHLKDQDSLYFDSIRVSGRIGRRKWSYNSAMPMRCYTLLYRLTEQVSYLDKALDIATASRLHWVQSSTGAIQCEAMFAFTLIEGWIELSQAVDDPSWRKSAETAMNFVHENVKDANGHYSKRWDDMNTKPITKWKLLYPAATARAYWALVSSDKSVSTKIKTTENNKLF